MSKGKLPAIQFYPADWRKDPGVQSLTFHERGVWLEILCLMHESPRRGYLLLPSGKPMSDEVLSRVIGLDKQILTGTLTSILECGVADRDIETGALKNRRMVRDDELRHIRSESGKKGGNPNLLKQKANQNTTTLDKQSGNQKPTPSSSSSSSSSATTLGDAASEAEIKEKPPDDDPLDEQIRTFIGSHPMLTYDAATHKKCRELVKAVGWSRAKILIEEGIAAKASFPIGWALAKAANEYQRGAASANGSESPARREYKSATKPRVIGAR